MKLKRKSLRTLLVLFISAGVVALTLASSGCGVMENQAKTGSNGNTANIASPLSAGIASPFFASEVEDLIKGKAPPAQTKSVSLDQAQKIQGFKVRVPKETLRGKLVQVNAEPTAADNPAIFCNYDSGLMVGAEIMKEKVDYKAEVAQEIESYKTASVYPDSPFHVVTIAGHEGKACAPWHEGEYKAVTMPPQLFWWDNGIQFGIVPYKLGFTEKQLIQVAESMYK